MEKATEIFWNDMFFRIFKKNYVFIPDAQILPIMVKHEANT